MKELPGHFCEALSPRSSRSYVLKFISMKVWFLNNTNLSGDAVCNTVTQLKTVLVASCNQQNGCLFKNDRNKLLMMLKSQD